MDKSGLPLFHFLFCELIEECYNNHKEGSSMDEEMPEFIKALKKAGLDVGYKIYNTICISKQITERPKSISAIVRNIQNKVFRFLFGYDIATVYTATQDGHETKNYVHVLVDKISIYLTWMPDHLWNTANFFAGVIEAICNCCGLKCEV